MRQAYYTNMDIFAALAEPTRRTIVEMLAQKGELSATDISDRFNSSPPAISQHLKVLREAKLVSVTKRSRQRIYRVNPAAFNEIDQWVRQTKVLWNTRLSRLDSLFTKKPRKIN